MKPTSPAGLGTYLGTTHHETENTMGNVRRAYAHEESPRRQDGTRSHTARMASITRRQERAIKREAIGGRP